MDEFSKRRAEKIGDNRLWSPKDALEDAIAAIKDVDPDKVCIAVHWFEKQEDGSRRHHYSAANCTFPEHMALLEVALKKVIDDWVLP